LICVALTLRVAPPSLGQSLSNHESAPDPLGLYMGHQAAFHPPKPAGCQANSKGLPTSLVKDPTPPASHLSGPRGFCTFRQSVPARRLRQSCAAHAGRPPLMPDP
jgi:hypothetical protein